jgi:predicted XRE-type DNA-binding protein
MAKTRGLSDTPEYQIWYSMKQTAITRGGGNIFADLGLPNADEHMLKARLVICIDKMIEHAELTQHVAAKKMGVSQPDVSDLLRGHFEGFSLERLLGFVRALGSDVEIKVKRRPQGEEGRLSLVT